MELSHEDIGDIRLALAHRVVELEDRIADKRGQLEDDEREECTETLARLKVLITRVDGERPAAQRRFVERL